MAGHRQNAKTARNTKNDGTTVGYEVELWKTANALHGSTRAAQATGALDLSGL